MDRHIQTALLLIGCTIVLIREGKCACTLLKPCVTPDGLTGVCLDDICSVQIDNLVRYNLTFIITVKYPETRIQQAGGSALYIRGNGLGFSWHKGIQLTKTGTDTWQTTVKYSSSIKGYCCQTCADRTALPGDKLEYRIIVDDHTDMLGANLAIQLPISQVSDYFYRKPELFAFPWFYSKSGSVTNVTIPSSEIGGNRSITLYHPPSYNENTHKVYPVLMSFDLNTDFTATIQSVFDDSIITHALSEEFIMIGFGEYQRGFTERRELLTQTVGVNWECLNGTFEDRCDGCLPEGTVYFNHESLLILKNKCGKPYYGGGKGDKTLDFLIHTVFPKANVLSGNRFTTDRNKIGIMGFSLGGLLSCHAAWTRPHIFGFAACQSPIFWWPLNNDTMTTCDFDFLNKTLADPNLQQNRPPQRIYLDTGDLETHEPYRQTQTTIEVARVITQHSGYEMNTNVWVNVIPGSPHSFYQWTIRMWMALKVLLPVQGATGMPNTPEESLVG